MAALGAKLNFSAGIAFTAPINSSSSPLSVSPKDLAGSIIVPGAIFGAFAICACAPVIQQAASANATTIRFIIVLRSCRPKKPYIRPQPIRLLPSHAPSFVTQKGKIKS